MNEWLRDNLVCPRDKQKLQTDGQNLICLQNHVYPVIDDIPIMLLDETNPTHGYITTTLEKVAEIHLSEQTGNEESTDFENRNEVDPFVQSEIVHTCGNLYVSLINNLNRYPIPELRLPDGSGKRLLDVGCNWGRWTIAAAQNGYQPVGIDPSLDAVLAARRVSRQLGAAADFVVGDSRNLPFASGCFDVGFSYSVFQHFSKEDAKISLNEIARVLKKGGKSLVQMPNKYGVRSFYNQLRRGFSKPEGFDVRYWTPTELMKTFTQKFGKTEISVDCYFGLNVQKKDVDLFPARYKAVVYSSEILRSWSRKLPFMTNVADSIYLESIKR